MGEHESGSDPSKGSFSGRNLFGTEAAATKPAMDTMILPRITPDMLKVRPEAKNAGLAEARPADAHRDAEVKLTITSQGINADAETLQPQSAAVTEIAPIVAPEHHIDVDTQAA